MCERCKVLEAELDRHVALNQRLTAALNQKNWNPDLDERQEVRRLITEMAGICAERDKAQKERDELLAACKFVMEWAWRPNSGLVWRNVDDKIRAAIAMTEGV